MNIFKTVFAVFATITTMFAQQSINFENIQQLNMPPVVSYYDIGLQTTPCQNMGTYALILNSPKSYIIFGPVSGTGTISFDGWINIGQGYATRNVYIFYGTNINNLTNVDTVQLSNSQCQKVSTLNTIPSGVYIKFMRQAGNINDAILIDNITADGGALPVELVSFEARYYNTDVLLSWKTATEKDNYGFDVYRSYDKDTWNLIGHIQGSGTSNSEKCYTYIDNITSYHNYTIYYKLKQIDRDGSYTYSNIVSVKYNGENITQINVTPTLINSTSDVLINMVNDCNMTLRIYDIAGNINQTLIDGHVKSGTSVTKIDVNKLKSGIYFVVANETSTNKEQLVKIIVAK